MFGIISYNVFLASSILLNITPGADTIYVLSKAVVGGRRKGIVSALGISTGILIHTVMVSLGLSVVLARSAVLFNIMKMLGAGYLLVMGIKAIISKASVFDFSNTNGGNCLTDYRQGVLTNALNPKVALFFLAFLPQFVSPDNIYGPLPFLILGITFFTTGTIWCVFLAYIASFASRLLARSERVQNIASKASGIVYILLGLNVLRAKIE